MAAVAEEPDLPFRQDSDEAVFRAFGLGIGRPAVLGRGLPSRMLPRKLTLGELLTLNDRFTAVRLNWRYRPGAGIRRSLETATRMTASL